MRHPRTLAIVGLRPRIGELVRRTRNPDFEVSAKSWPNWTTCCSLKSLVVKTPRKVRSARPVRP